MAGLVGMAYAVMLLFLISILVLTAEPAVALLSAEEETAEEELAADEEGLEDLFDPSKHEYYPAPRRRLQGSAPGFKIDLIFESSMRKVVREGFIAARDKWMSVIKSDLASTTCVRAKSRVCGRRLKRKLCWDDLLIFARVGRIDGSGSPGRGNIAGYAGPCGYAYGMPRVGEMVFDIYDINSVINAGVWNKLVLHEMGHVLGFGTLWEGRRLLTPQSQGTPYYYLGTNGLAGLRTLTGNSRSAIVVEDEGGPGSVRGHWKESIFGSEVMTSILELSYMPLSLMTVRAMEDIGYTVDYSAAEPYTVGARPAAEKEAGKSAEEPMHFDLGNDMRPQNDVVELTDVKPKRGREADFESLKAKYETRKAKESAK